jgi:hypothetical protein
LKLIVQSKDLKKMNHKLLQVRKKEGDKKRKTINQ